MSFVPFAALVAASFFGPQGSTALPYRSAAHTGEMFASTVSSDLTRAYVGEGDQIAIVDISTDPGTTDAAVANQIALVPVDATVMGLVRHDLSTDKQVFIAGGSFGLLSMSATETIGCTPCQMGSGSCHPVVTIDDSADPSATPPGDNERWCWDVGVGEVQMSGGGKRSFVLALFSSQQDQLGTELRIYRRSTMALLYRVKMTDVYTAAGITPPSTAFGFGIDTKQTVTAGVPSFGNLVYVAMGTGGVIRVDLTPLATGSAPTASVGHLFTPGSIAGFTPALSVTLGGSAVNGIVRDVSVAEDSTVYAAVDGWGAVELDPTTAAPLVAVNLFATVAHSYADHIDATVVNNEVQIAVGGYAHSSIGEADAPFVTYGRFNYAIDVGGDLPIAYTAGQSALYYFHKSAGGGSTLPTTPSNVSVGSNGGHFNLRPSPNSSTELWFYEQYWWHGGLELYTPSSGPAVAAGFQWHKVSTATYAKNTRRYYAGLGASWLGMTRLLLDPNLVLAQLEGGHGSNSGTNYVDITNRDCLTHVVGDPNFAVTSVFTPKAHWTTGSGSSTEEWWVAAREQAGATHSGFTLSRVTNPGGGGLAYERWGLRSPRAPDCYLTRNYHQASMYQDAVSGEHRILGTFQTTLGGGNTIASPWAGVLYKRDTLMQRANLVTCYDGALFPDPPTGTDCATTGTQCYFTDYPVGGGATAPNYVAPVVVHPELLAWTSGGTHLETNPMTFTGESEVLEYTVGGVVHSIAVIAAGRNANDTDNVAPTGTADDPDFKKAKLVLVDLDAPQTLTTSCSTSCTSGPSTYYAPGAGMTVYAPQSKGLAAALEIVTYQTKRFAIVGDWGGRLHIFDITNPSAPTYRQSWVLPVSVLDGQIDNVADLEVDDADLASHGNLDIYMSVLRIGVVRLSAGYNKYYDPTLPIASSNGVPFTLPAQSYTAANVFKIDSPGLAHEMELVIDPVDGDRGLLLADKHGGLRLYGDF